MLLLLCSVASCHWCAETMVHVDGDEAQYHMSRPRVNKLGYRCDRAWRRACCCCLVRESKARIADCSYGPQSQSHMRSEAILYDL
jgi:hypothetical protein